MTSELTSTQKRVIAENFELIQRIIKYEQDHEEEYKNKAWKMAWEYDNVRADGTTLYRLFTSGILDMPYGSGGRHKSYCLCNLKSVASYVDSLKAMQTEEKVKSTVSKSSVIVTPEIFADIVGYDDIKQILVTSLNAEEPVHILFIGPPASAKSLFLMGIETLDNVVFALGGSTTKVGLRDILIETPRYLIIDEIDKISSSGDLSALLSWMENGRVSIHKHNNHVDVKGKGWVIAAGNSERGIPPELKSRFITFTLPKYSKQDFKTVCVKVLISTNSLETDLAEYIAEKLSNTTRDVRDAIKVSRLCKTKEQVDIVLKTLERYK